MARQQTNGELYLLIKDRLDEAGSPRWDTTQVARVFNMVYDDWLRASCDRLEEDEKARRDLGPLMLTAIRTITTKVFDLQTLKPHTIAIVSVAAEWERDVMSRGSGQVRKRLDSWPVSPIKHDRKALAAADPWNAPADDNAKYSESRGVTKNALGVDAIGPVSLTLQCSTQPVRIKIDYVHEPDLVNFLTGDKEKTEVDFGIQMELVRRTVAILASTDENFPVAQAGYQEINLTS